MASSNYTTNLHLNAWVDSDRPKRADFVSDNNIIDTALGGHLADTTLHLTAEEKAKVSEPFTVSGYAGSGSAGRTITLGFTPKMAFVFKRGKPFTAYGSSETVVNAAWAAYSHGASSGLSITSNGVQVSEDAQAVNGVRISLNESGAQYTVIAFK